MDAILEAGSGNLNQGLDAHVVILCVISCKANSYKTVGGNLFEACASARPKVPKRPTDKYPNELQPGFVVRSDSDASLAPVNPV
jgi:hypothetical protein